MALTSNPSRYTMTTSETIPFTWDVTSLLETGQTPSNPSVSITRVIPQPEADTPGGLVGSPSVNGNVIEQGIQGSGLALDHVYRVDVTFDADVDTTLTMQTFLYVENAQPYATDGGVTRQEIRQRVGIELGDMERLTATSGGSNISFVDVNGINQPRGEYGGRYIYFYDGTTANIGEMRVISQNDFSSSTIYWTRALPANVAIGDQAELWNRRAEGWSPNEINDLIYAAHSEASVYNQAPITQTVTSAFSADLPNNFVTLGSHIREIRGVDYLNGSGAWVPIERRKAHGPGYWVDEATRGLYLEGTYRAAAVNRPVRIRGFAREAPLTHDAHRTIINSEWIRDRVCEMACLMLLTKTPDANLVRDKLNRYEMSSRQKRTLVIPRKPVNVTRVIW